MQCVDFSVAIIAGGQGRRLGGVTKALLEVKGRTVLSRLEALAAGRPVVIVTQTPDAFPGHLCVPDVVAGKGAPGGVVTALLSVTTEWVLVVGSDMPFLEALHVEGLVRAAEPTDEVVVATREEQLEPLFGLYRRSLGPRWQARLDADPSLRALITESRWRGVPLDPSALDSLNTPDDLRRANATLPR